MQELVGVSEIAPSNPPSFLLLFELNPALSSSGLLFAVVRKKKHSFLFSFAKSLLDAYCWYVPYEPVLVGQQGTY